MVKGSTPYIIDVSQAVSIDHVNAIDFLRHDLDTINRFFAEAGVDIEYFKDLYNKIFEVFNEYSIKRV
jgi:RIO kinase 1